MLKHGLAAVALIAVCSLSVANDEPPADQSPMTETSDGSSPRKLKTKKRAIERPAPTTANIEEVTAKAQTLYACRSFFSFASRSSDRLVRERAKELSSVMMFKATLFAVDAGGPDAVAPLENKGGAEYRSFLANLQNTPSQDDRNKAIQQFISNCSTVANTPIDIPIRAEHLVPDRSAVLAKARTLYSCHSFFSAGSASAGPEQKMKLQRISMFFLTKATQESVGADADKNPLNAELSKQLGNSGESDFREFMASLDSLPTEADRTARLDGFVKNCMATAGLPKQ